MTQAEAYWTKNDHSLSGYWFGDTGYDIVAGVAGGLVLDKVFHVKPKFNFTLKVNPKKKDFKATVTWKF